MRFRNFLYRVALVAVGIALIYIAFGLAGRFVRIETRIRTSFVPINGRMFRNLRINTAVNTSIVRERESTSGSDYLITSQAEKAPLTSSAKTKETPKVLIVAYYRSGSSFLAHILNHSTNAFYSFEPLKALYYFGVEKREPITFIGSNATAEPIAMGYQVPMVKKVIDSILTCDLAHLYNKSAFTAKTNTSFGSYHKCISEEGNRQDCLQQYITVCKKSQLTLIKTIRLSMLTVEYFLKKHSNLKVIHLIRDPRGSLCSMGCPQKRKWIRHCSAMKHDVTTRVRLQKLYPGRIMEVIYEDLAHHPYKMAEKLYSFIGKTFGKVDYNWMRNHTMAGEEYDGKQGCIRPNSTETAYSWVYRMSEEHFLYANTYCHFTLRHGRFIRMSLVNETKSFVIPRRRLFM